MSDRHASRPDTPSPAGAPLGDEVIGGLVRDVAADWAMPPQRLGERSWRVRVQERESARAGGGWRRRVTVSATLAVAATVALAVSAIWLNGQGRLPTTGNDSSASPSTAATPGATGPSPSPAPLPSPLPTLATFGDPLPVSTIVLSGDGHRVLDLTTGLLGPAMKPDFFEPLSMLRRDGGGWTCVCFTTHGLMWSEASEISVVLVDSDATGAATGSRPLETYGDGVPDPAGGMIQGVGAIASPAERPDRVYLGWVVRRSGGWQSGVDVVDLAAGRVVQKVRLPDLPLEEGTDASGNPFKTQVDPPVVTVSPDGGRVVISRIAYAIRRDTVSGIDFVPMGSGLWGAPITAGEVGQLTAFASGEETLDPASCPFLGNPDFASADVFIFSCSTDVLRRLDPRDGRRLGDVRVDGLDGSPGWVAAAEDGRRYAWYPLERTLVEIDAVGGKVLRRTTIDGLTGMVESGSGDPLDVLADLGRRLGRWITPPAQAKILIEGGILLSPDGSRLYLLGFDGEWPDQLGTTGVHVVDTASLTEVATWAPTADWASMAVSSDGSLLYLFGAPGMAVDVNGGVVSDPGRPASLTVLDAATGEPRLIAGQLDVEYAFLDPALVP